MRNGVDVRDLLFKKSGVDLFTLPGLGADTLLTLASEVGFDLRPWKTEKHFAFWLGICPGTKRSGGQGVGRKNQAQSKSSGASVSHGRRFLASQPDRF